MAATSSDILRLLRRSLIWGVLIALGFVFLDWNRKLMGLLTDAEFATKVHAGDPIVQAVYDYKKRTGDWPPDENALEIAAAPKPDYWWHYIYHGNASPPFVTIHPVMHCIGRYRFPNYALPLVPPSNEWDFRGGDAIRAWGKWKSTAVPPRM